MVPTGGGGARRAGPRWLTDEELATWRALSEVLARLPTALGSQLQCDSDLSFVEYYVLAALSDQPDRTIRMTRLAVLTNAELSRLSHLITRLEKRGLVRRQPDPHDGRYTRVALTDDGYAHLVEAAPGHVEMVRKLIFDVLDPTVRRALHDAARSILAGLDDCDTADE